jgi:hypothetical protein
MKVEGEEFEEQNIMRSLYKMTNLTSMHTEIALALACAVSG